MIIVIDIAVNVSRRKNFTTVIRRQKRANEVTKVFGSGETGGVDDDERAFDVRFADLFRMKCTRRQFPTHSY
jgi:hypothetical protein